MLKSSSPKKSSAKSSKKTVARLVRSRGPARSSRSRSPISRRKVEPIYETVFPLFPLKPTEDGLALWMLAIWGKAKPKAVHRDHWNLARWEAKRWFLVQAKDEKQALTLVTRWLQQLEEIPPLTRSKPYRAKNGARILDLGRNNV